MLTTMIVRRNRPRLSGGLALAILILATAGCAANSGSPSARAGDVLDATPTATPTPTPTAATRPPATADPLSGSTPPPVQAATATAMPDPTSIPTPLPKEVFTQIELPRAAVSAEKMHFDLARSGNDEFSWIVLGEVESRQTGWMTPTVWESTSMDGPWTATSLPLEGARAAWIWSATRFNGRTYVSGGIRQQIASQGALWSQAPGEPWTLTRFDGNHTNGEPLEGRLGGLYSSDTFALLGQSLATASHDEDLELTVLRTEDGADWRPTSLPGFDQTVWSADLADVVDDRAIVVATDDDTQSRLKIWTSDDRALTWTSFDLELQADEGAANPLRIEPNSTEYFDGRWLVGAGLDTGTGAFEPTLFASTDDGSWTQLAAEFETNDRASGQGDDDGYGATWLHQFEEQLVALSTHDENPIVWRSDTGERWVVDRSGYLGIGSGASDSKVSSMARGDDRTIVVRDDNSLALWDTNGSTPLVVDQRQTQQAPNRRVEGLVTIAGEFRLSSSPLEPPVDTRHFVSPDARSWELSGNPTDRDLYALDSTIDGRFRVEVIADDERKGVVRLLSGKWIRILDFSDLLRDNYVSGSLIGPHLVEAHPTGALVAGQLNPKNGDDPDTFFAWISPSLSEPNDRSLPISVNGSFTPVLTCPHDDEGIVGIVSHTEIGEREPEYQIDFVTEKFTSMIAGPRFGDIRVDGCFRTPDDELIFTGERCSNGTLLAPHELPDCGATTGVIGVATKIDSEWAEHPKLDQMVNDGFRWTQHAFAFGDGAVVLTNGRGASLESTLWYVTATDAWRIPHSGVVADEQIGRQFTAATDTTFALVADTRLYVAHRSELMEAILAAKPR